MQRLTIVAWKIAAVGVPLFAMSVYAQIAAPASPNDRSPRQTRQLVTDTGKLLVTLHLDRNEYFPGEEAVVSVSVVNPGPGTLEVFEAFHVATGIINIYAHDAAKPKTDSRSWRRLAPDESPGTIAASAPTVWIQPAYKLEKTHVTSDPATHTSKDSSGREASTICSLCSLPEDEGDYRVCYHYGSGSCADFTVVWPVLEQWTEVVLAKPAQWEEILPNQKPSGHTRTGARVVRVMVLGYKGSHILAVSARPIGRAGRTQSDPSGKLTGFLSRDFGVHRRLVTSALPITSLQAVESSSESITITYTDQSGKQFTLRLNSDHQLAP